MEIKDFFYHGGIVKCLDRTESDVAIEMCREAGLDIYPYHNPDNKYHGVYWEDTMRQISFYRNGAIVGSVVLRSRSGFPWFLSQMSM